MPDPIKLDLDNVEVKAAITKAAEERAAVLAQTIAEGLTATALEEKTLGLVNKNTELLGEKKAVKLKNDELTAQLAGITEKYNFEDIDAQLAAAALAKEEAMSAEERNTLRMERLQETSLAEKEALSNEYSEYKTATETELETVRNALYKNLKGNQIQATISEFKGISKLLEPLISRDVKVIQNDDGTFEARVFKDGKVAYDLESNTPMSISQLVKSYKDDDDYGALFEASKASGSNADGSSSKEVKQKASAFKRSEMSISQKTAYVKEHGQDGYMKLDA